MNAPGQERVVVSLERVPKVSTGSKRSETPEKRGKSCHCNPRRVLPGERSHGGVLGKWIDRLYRAFGKCRHSAVATAHRIGQRGAEDMSFLQAYHGPGRDAGKNLIVKRVPSFVQTRIPEPG